MSTISSPASSATSPTSPAQTSLVAPHPTTPIQLQSNSAASSTDSTASAILDGAALVSEQLRVARDILFSPPVKQARRASLRWSAPLSPDSLEEQLHEQTKQTRQSKVAVARRGARKSFAIVEEEDEDKEHPNHYPLHPPPQYHDSPHRTPSRSVASIAELLDLSSQSASSVTIDPADDIVSTELQLHLSDPVAEDEGAALLASAIISSAHNLTSLKAFIQHVGDKGARALAEALQTPGLVLRHIDLRFRQLILSGASLLCQSLMHLQRLESLTLRCCSLGDEGVRWLCAAFLQGSTESRLITLDLNENGITDVGCLAIGQLIMRHRTLKTLSLEENCIGTRGAYVLGKAMASWRTARRYAEARITTPRPHRRTQSLQLPSSITVPSDDPSSSAISPTNSRPASTFATPVTRKLQPFPVPVAFTPGPPISSPEDETHHRRYHEGSEQRSAQNGTLDETIVEDHAGEDHDFDRSGEGDESDLNHAHVGDDGDTLLLSDELNTAFLATLKSLPAELSSNDPSAAPSTVHSAAHSRRASTSMLPSSTRHLRANSDELPCVLQVLNLRFNKIDVNDLTVIAPNSANQPGLPTFSQPQAILARYLTVSPETTGLVHLDLSLNSLADEGAIVLARSLAHNLSLKVLNVNYCHISDRGGIALARALAFNSTLTSLFLSTNFISTTSATSFSDSLSINTSLRTLDLSLNLFDDSAIWGISDAIGLNTTLTDLDLHSNFLSDEGAEALARAVIRNSTLKYLNVDQNPMSDEGIELVQLALGHDQRGSPSVGGMSQSNVDQVERRIRLQTKISALMTQEEQDGTLRSE